MPQTSQHNGVSKRKNITIMKMVRCMLKEKKKLSKKVLGRCSCICCVFVE